MRVLRSITALVILLSSATQAGTMSSPETCQRMVLLLLENFDVNQSESKEQLIQFAKTCMPESELNKQSSDFQTLPLVSNGRKSLTTQTRI